jgi:hypothetical protein
MSMKFSLFGSLSVIIAAMAPEFSAFIVFVKKEHSLKAI